MEPSEIRSLIVALLAFCVPIVAAIVDKRAKARKQTPQVNAKPIDFEELERNRQAAAVPVRAESRPVPVQAKSKPAPVPAPDKAKQTPQRRQPTGPETNPTAAEIRKDCRKLILYSEILKPKYDDFG